MMIHRKAVCFLFFLLSFASPLFAAGIAQVVAVSGSATVGGKALTTASTINEHDTITVTSGTVQILFTDGTKMVIGDKSSLVIEKYLMRGGSTAQSVTVDALRGTFRFITGRSAKPAYDIKTANATIGIRGTGFDFWVDSDTGVAVLQGKVRLCRNNVSGARKCVDIDANCHAGIAESGGARPLVSLEQSTRMKNHLPYIVDQSFLKPAFKLNIASCERVLGLTNDAPSNFGNGRPGNGCKGRACN